MSATYLVWHPRVSAVRGGQRVAFNITPGSANPALAPTPANCREIMADLEWSVPDGIRRMKVGKIHYQPEAAGDFHR